MSGGPARACGLCRFVVLAGVLSRFCVPRKKKNSEAAKEATYLRDFLGELGFGDEEPTPLGMDNQAGRDLAYNPQHHPRTKHIARRHFFIREKVEDHTLVVPFVRTVDNLADFFTKPLGAKTFFPMRDAIMNVRG